MIIKKLYINEYILLMLRMKMNLYIFFLLTTLKQFLLCIIVFFWYIISLGDNMLINKFSKQKNGMYKIQLEDGNSILAHEDIILKYDLLLKKNITQEDKEKIEEENLTYISYDLAIKYISKKMRTAKEIREYLENKKVDKTIIDHTITMLEKSNYIDERVYAKSFINDKINFTNDGPNKILRELIVKGIKEEIATDEILIYDKKQQLEKIEKISKKIVSTNRNKSAYLLKNKIINVLINLGYEKSLIISKINQMSLNDNPDIAKKEYEKIYKKLSKKYSGSELEYKMKQKMSTLGFKNYNMD